jgi:pimeloyl-ACP methyl ester carboxylesterase
MISYPMRAGTVVTRVLQAGSGEPVVFVHGTGGRAERWSRNLDAIARTGRTAYAIDLPGHGFADKGPGVACSVAVRRRAAVAARDTALYRVFACVCACFSRDCARSRCSRLRAR